MRNHPSAPPETLKGSPTGLVVDRVDHVHVRVPDRDTAAAWYARVLGLRRHEDLGAWAADDGGPLILAAGDGRPALALFAAAPEEPRRDGTIAFRTDGEGFCRFLASLPDLGLSARSGRSLTAADVVDHTLAVSLYFTDPFGNALELTTYDHEVVRTALAKTGAD